MRVVTVTNATREKLIGSQIRIADTSLSRMVGLLPKQNLAAGEGLWIRPSSGVHTLGMRFPIDVVGLDRSLRVVKVWHHLVPFRITSVSLKLRSVIELKAGSLEECGVQVGDLLTIT